MKKVLLINAPPDSGKDEAARIIIDLLTSKGIKSQHKEFKSTLFKAVKSAYGITNEVWEELYTRENKELPSYYLTYGGVPISPRQAMINMSEDVMKPLFGEKVFGIAAANSLEDGWNIFSDSGFDEEALPIINICGRENVKVLQIIRPNKTFEGDSRYWLSTHLLGVGVEICKNTGSLEEFHDTLIGNLIDLGVIDE